jgi:hypothetical protein
MGLALWAALGMMTVAPCLPAQAAEFDPFTRDLGDITSRTVGKPGTVGCVATGSVRGRLSFAVFSPSPSDGKPVACPVTEQSILGFRPDGNGYLKSRKVLLNLPKSGSVQLPIRAQLIEVKDGAVRLSARRVTLKELNSYLDSDDAECSLDDLLRYVDAQRKRSK